MFTCNFCKQTVKAGTACKMVTVARRWFQHPYRQKVNKLLVIEEGRRKKEWIDDPGGEGYQITREVKACMECSVRYEQAHKDR